MNGRNSHYDRKAVLRIIDANANRCSEGLRVIEEIVRFASPDEVLQREIKDIRHLVRRAAEDLAPGSIEFRDSDEDIGRGYSTKSENYRSSFAEIERANLLRAQESLRVLEEFGKLIDPKKALVFKALRFRVYRIDKVIRPGAGNRASLPPAPFLYTIIDRSTVTAGMVSTVAAKMVEGCAGMIQYRAKEEGRDEKLRDLAEIAAHTGGTGIPLIVNDDPGLAFEAGADGVHLGKDDGDPVEARAILGGGKIVGLTVHTEDEMKNAPVEALDYIAVGAAYRSETKPTIPTVTPEFFKLVRETCRLPVVAIGGIDKSNADRLLDIGVEGLAVISAVLKGDVGKNCFTFKRIIDRKRKNL